MSKLNIFKNQSGMSLIEITVALGISMIVMLQGKALISMSATMSQEIKSSYDFMSLMSMVKLEMNKPKFKNATASQNAALNNCRLTESACAGSSPNYSDIPINLYKERGPGNYVRISGTPAIPLIYDKDGKVRTGASKPKFSIESTATPICENDCDPALPPEGMRYKVVLKKLMHDNSGAETWVPLKQFSSYETLRVRQDQEAEIISCGTSDGVYRTLSQSIVNGVVQCDWIENPGTLPDEYTGAPGPQGTATYGRTGSTGTSRCTTCTPDFGICVHITGVSQDAARAYCSLYPAG